MAKQMTDSEYFKYAQSHLVIDSDDFGTFAKVPSQARPEESYRVDIDESDSHNVHAVKCSCYRFSKRGCCKHATIVNAFYGRIISRIINPRKPQPAAKVTSIAERGTLNPQMPGWLAILPSRQGVA